MCHYTFPVVIRFDKFRKCTRVRCIIARNPKVLFYKEASENFSIHFKLLADFL